MKPEDLGETDVVTGEMSVEDVVRRRTDGYESESEESEFSMSDSVHYTDSELDEDDCSDDDCSICAHRQKAPLAEEEQVVEEKMELVPAEPPRRLTIEETVRVSMCHRSLSSLHYGPYRIFFDIEIDGNFLGRVIIQLANHDVICRDNFDKLCTGRMKRRGQLNMHFTGTKIHRMEDGKFLEGGILRPLNPENAQSLYDEKPVLDPVYYDSYIMIANKSINDDYGGARFLITTTNTVKHYDREHIPVGCIVTGTEVIDRLTELPRNERGFFIPSITIGHCGSIKKTKEEHERCGKYEKSPKQYRNYYPYKLHDRLNQSKENDVVVRTSSSNIEV